MVEMSYFCQLHVCNDSYGIPLLAIILLSTELCQRMLFYCSWHKVHHFFIHHAAGLSVTATILLLAFCFVWHEKNCRDSTECTIIRELKTVSHNAAPLNIKTLRKNPLSANTVDNVESFVIFLGMEDRIFGHLLNHHPEVAIADGFNLFQRWHYQNSVLQSKSLLLTLLAANAANDYPNVFNSLESATHKLTVVGDYSTFNLTTLCATSPVYCFHVYTQLQEVLRIPIKFIQVRLQLRTGLPVAFAVMYLEISSRGVRLRFQEISRARLDAKSSQ